MLVHYADYLLEHGHQPTAAYFAQEMNWGNAAMGELLTGVDHLVVDFRSLSAATSRGSSGLWCGCGRTAG